MTRTSRFFASNKTHSEPILNPIPQVRGFVGTRQTVLMPISHGRNASEPTQCSSVTMPKRVPNPTSEVNKKDFNNSYKTVVTNIPSQVVVVAEEAEEAPKEATQEAIQSSSKAV